MEHFAERELPGFPGRLVPPMGNKHYLRRCGPRRAGMQYPAAPEALDQVHHRTCCRQCLHCSKSITLSPFLILKHLPKLGMSAADDSISTIASC